MSGDPSIPLDADLLDDFYAECDEHLSNVRQQLLALEQPHADPAAIREAIDSCFRSVHSVKGNSAIVGLRSAERLSHAAEGLLRGVLRNETPLGAEALQLLSSATRCIEQLISAHRLKQPPPDCAGLVEALQRRTAAPASESAARVELPPPSTSASFAERFAQARARGLHPVRCVFLPSQELDRRGININAVRSRLGKLGEILSAAPSVRPDGSMQFEFALAVKERPAELAAWNTDGLLFDFPDEPPEVGRKPEPSAATPTTGASASLFISPSHIVRVDLSRLDELMRITGEMVIQRSRLDERIARGDVSGLREINIALDRSLRELRDAVTRVRLVSVAEIFTRMPFVVQDLARDTGRRVRLVLEGQHTEIDKYLVERLKEPLLHLVRNAVSHGVEPPSVRVAAGKPEEATLILQAETIAHSVIIRVRDDGRGVDTAAVIARAKEAGIPISQAPDNHELLEVICRQGFSTRDEADRASGRGVGMAVVQNTLRELGGSLALETAPGRGTQFTLRLPLTLSISETFIVSAGRHTCAIPQEYVQEVIQLEPDQFHFINQREAASYRDGVLPVLRLRALFEPGEQTRTHAPALVLGTDRGLVGVVVDRVIGRREVVVHSIQDPLVQVPCVSGATELGDGRPVLILDPNALAARLARVAARHTHPNPDSLQPA